MALEGERSACKSRFSASVSGVVFTRKGYSLRGLDISSNGLRAGSNPAATRREQASPLPAFGLQVRREEPAQEGRGLASREVDAEREERVEIGQKRLCIPKNRKRQSTVDSEIFYLA